MGDNRTTGERITALEVRFSALCRDVRGIRGNDFPHLQERIDTLREKVAEIDKKLSVAQMKLAIVISVGIFVIMKLLDYFLVGR